MSLASRLRSPLPMFVTWWLLWSIIGTFIIHGLGFPWRIAFADAALSQLDWTIAGYVLNLMLKYYRPSTKNIMNLVFFSLALSALFTYVILPFAIPQIIDRLGGTVGYQNFLDSSLTVRFVFAWMQLLFIAATIWMWYFLEEQKQTEKQRTDTERLAREAELVQLRQQLQPHFLFNSLNSINALVGSQPDLARKMIQQLSDFLRGTVKKDDRQLVTFEEELKQLSLYLDIEKVRFGYRLKSEIIADENSRAMKLPPLLLQPIVENAIKFGLYDTIGEITITISANGENDSLNVSVSNPFDPETSRRKQGTGFGLNSISRRLYLIYHHNNLLQTSSANSVFTTTIKIPQV